MELCPLPLFAVPRTKTCFGTLQLLDRGCALAPYLHAYPNPSLPRLPTYTSTTPFTTVHIPGKTFFQREYWGHELRILVSFPIRFPLTLSFLRVFPSFSHNPIFTRPCFVGYLRYTLPHDTVSKRINAFIMSMLFLLIMHMNKCSRPIRVDRLLSLPILSNPLGHTIVASMNNHDK